MFLQRKVKRPDMLVQSTMVGQLQPCINFNIYDLNSPVKKKFPQKPPPPLK